MPLTAQQYQAEVRRRLGPKAGEWLRQYSTPGPQIVPGPGGAQVVAGPGIRPQVVGRTTNGGGSAGFSWSSPYSGQIQSLLSQAQQMMAAGPPTAEQLMSRPEYQDYLRRQREQAQAAFDQVRAMLAGGGIAPDIQSTPAVKQFGQIERAAQEDARAFLGQLLQQEMEQRQAQVAQALSLLSTLGGLESQAFQQALGQWQANEAARQFAEQMAQRQAEFAAQQALAEAGLTGIYQGRPTIQARQFLAELTGVNPMTGQPTFAARQWQEQMALARQQAAADEAYRRAQLGLAQRELASRLAAMNRLTPEQAVSAILSYASAGGQITPEMSAVLRGYGIPVPPGRFGQADDPTTQRMMDLVAGKLTTRKGETVQDINTFRQWYRENYPILQRQGVDVAALAGFAQSLFPPPPPSLGRRFLDWLGRIGAPMAPPQVQAAYSNTFASTPSR